MAGNDGGLNLAAPVQHLLQNLFQLGKRRFPSNVIRALDVLVRDERKRLAHGLRRMVERTLDRDLRVMQAVGIQFHLGAAGASAKEVHYAAAAHHVHGPLPGLRTAHGFNHNIRTTAFGHADDLVDWVCSTADLHDFVGAKTFGRRYLFSALDHADHFTSGELGYLHQHESQRAGADHRDGIADVRACFLQTAQRTSQRLRHGGGFKANVVRQGQHVGLNNAPRNLDVLRVGPVVEQQVLTDIFLVLQAVKAGTARSGVESDNLHTAAEITHAWPDFFNHSGKFMSKQRRRHDHARVVAALINFEVGAASQGHVHLHQDLTGLQRGNGDFFYLDVLFAVEDRSCHLSFQLFSHSIPGCMTTFIDSGPGCEATFNASTACCNPNRCVINCSSSIPPLNTSRTFSSCKSTDALYEPKSVFSSTQIVAGSMATSLRCVCAKSMILPPGRAASIAGRTRLLPAVAKMTASAPRPSVSSRTRFIGSATEALILCRNP